MDIAAVFVAGGPDGRRVGIAITGPALPSKNLSVKTAKKSSITLYEFQDNDHLAFLEHALLVLRPVHVYLGHSLSGAAADGLLEKLVGNINF